MNLVTLLSLDPLCSYSLYSSLTDLLYFLYVSMPYVEKLRESFVTCSKDKPIFSFTVASNELTLTKSGDVSTI